MQTTEAKKTKQNPTPCSGEFFSTSCVPGALSPAYNGKLQNPRMMCELCGGDSGGDFCAKNMDEPYYGQTGAFKCLVEKGDVAFTSHRAVLGEITKSYRLQAFDISSSYM